jgi:hypothetical protein
VNRLHELRKPLLEMTGEELRRHIEHIRAERLIVKEKPQAKRKKVVASATSRSKASKLLASMTPAEMQRLLEDLEDEGSD